MRLYGGHPRSRPIVLFIDSKPAYASSHACWSVSAMCPGECTPIGRRLAAEGVERAVVQVDERAEPGGRAADDRQHQAVAVPRGADDRLRGAADSDPGLEPVLGLREHVRVGRAARASSPAT